MKKTNRFISLLTAASAMAAIMLCGCGSAGGGNSAPAANDVTAATTAEKSYDGDDSLNKVLDSGKFILGLDATFEPMGYTDENDQIVGFDIDVAQEVCVRLGVELVKQPIDWDTKEDDLNSGKIDCIWNGMSVNPSRQEQMNLSESYMRNQMVFVVAEGSPITDQSGLNRKNVAVQSGSSAQELLEGCGLNITIIPIATNEEALRQLDEGLADSVFLDSVVADYKILNSGKSYSILLDGLASEEYAIGFRKNDQALRDKVQDILHEMKEDGTLAEISKKWFGKDVTIIK